MTSWAVLTDLDGTLLDHHSYDWRAAEPALRSLAEAEIPVYAMTSKTAAEMPAILAEIPWLGGLYSCENGAVLVDRRPGQDQTEVLGIESAKLIHCFEQLCRQLLLLSQGFHQVSDQQVADWTGLPVESARMARKRQASLPIFWASEDQKKLPAFRQAAGQLGLKVLQGGRFVHLTGNADKGTALAAVRKRLGSGIRLMALGDGGNDDAMLTAADLGVRIPAATDSERVETLSGLFRAPFPGPEGWNATVLQWLNQGLRL